MGEPWTVLGLGNRLMADDGIGVHAIERLVDAPPAHAGLFAIGTAVLDALPLVEQAEKLILIDAMRNGGLPGTIYVMTPGRIEPAQDATSLHSLGLLDLFQRLTPGVALPPTWIVGMEPARIDYDETLSKDTLAAMPRLLETVRNIIARTN